MSAERANQPGATSTRAKLLFVDDEERVLRLLRMMFRASYDVFTTTDAAEALEIMARVQIDVIVSDQRMPKMTGIELLAKVRESSPNTVRLLLTGYSDLVAIIGAVNEGEVYRFLNKPWNQQEITNVIAEAAALALSKHAVPASTVREPRLEEPAGEGALDPDLANATALLALDGIENNRYEIMEMFTEEFRVLGAESINEAVDILEENNVGVIVTAATIDGVNVIDLLGRLRAIRPSLTVVVLTDVVESDMVIELINKGQIYRFAMKPVQPNVFRLAVHAAMKEHHRRLADPRLTVKPPESIVSRVEEPSLVESIVSSVSRFTKIWPGQKLDN